MLVTRKEETNHMLAGAKSVLAVNSEAKGFHGTVDGKLLPFYGYCS